jgi:hypothetical protein
MKPTTKKAAKPRRVVLANGLVIFSTWYLPPGRNSRGQLISFEEDTRRQRRAMAEQNWLWAESMKKEGKAP